MALNSSIVPGIGYVTSAFRAFKDSPLFARVNWVFMLYIGCVAAGTAYCLSSLYQAYQLKFNPSFGLDNRFKLIKCRALFEEGIEIEKTHNGSLFQQCELLLASVGNDDFASIALDKNALLLRLALHYAENEPDHSYEIAKKLTSSDDLFKAAQTIQKKHPDFDSEKLNSLYTQTFNAMTQERTGELKIKLDWLDFNLLLKLAKAFHSVNNRDFVKDCMEEALQLANTNKSDLNQISALCEIAECCQEIGFVKERDSRIKSAQSLLEKIPNTELVEARLDFADLFCSLKEVDKMDQELNEVIKLIDANPLQTANSLYRLKKLIIKAGKDEKSKSTFKEFEIESRINRVLHVLKDTTSKNATTARAYLKIASVYEELIDDLSSKKLVLSRAFDIIQNLPENDIKSKFDLLTSLVGFYKQSPQKAQQILETLEALYDKCPLNDNSRPSLDKFGCGHQIMYFYNKFKLKEQSNRFFQKYLSDLQKQDTPFSKIDDLCTYAKNYKILDDDHYLPEQRRTQLEAAESILSELKSSSSYERALGMVIEGYLQVDRQKSLQLLEDYAHQASIKPLKIAAITGVTTGLFYFYPQAYPVWALGLTVVRLF